MTKCVSLHQRSVISHFFASRLCAFAVNFFFARGGNEKSPARKIASRQQKNIDSKFCDLYIVYYRKEVKRHGNEEVVQKVFVEEDHQEDDQEELEEVTSSRN